MDILKRLLANLSSTSLFPFAPRPIHPPALLTHWLLLSLSLSFFRHHNCLGSPPRKPRPTIAIGLDPSASGVPVRMIGRRSGHLRAVVRSVHAVTREPGAVAIGRARRGACCLAMWRATGRLAAAAAATPSSSSSLAGGGKAVPLHLSSQAGGCFCQSSRSSARWISPASLAGPKVNGAR